MTGPTHRVYAVLFAYIATMIIYSTSISSINYYFILILIILLSKKGAIFPDLDHAWCNIGDKNIPNKIINTLIHVTGGKHRSWQTHSLDICVIFTLISYELPRKLYEVEKISLVNFEVLSIILLGFASGWISHLFSDSLTSSGIRAFCWNKNIIIRLVPKKIGNLRFNTGHEWEAFNFKVISILNKVVGIICLAYPVLIKSNLLNYLLNM